MNTPTRINYRCCLVAEDIEIYNDTDDTGVLYLMKAGKYCLDRF